jgi:hypothetical protein
MPPCCNRRVNVALIYRPPTTDAKIDPHAFDSQVGTVVPLPWGREGQMALMLCVSVEVAPDGCRPCSRTRERRHVRSGRGSANQPLAHHDDAEFATSERASRPDRTGCSGRSPQTVLGTVQAGLSDFAMPTSPVS